MNTRILVPTIGIAALLVTLFFLAPVPATDASAQAANKAPAAAATPIEVYKTPTCGCCGKWVEHMKAQGFAPTVHDLPDLSAVRSKHGVPAHLQSCHTAVVNGYVVEGHVPADVVRQLLKEKPKVAGITVPGMPMGSPGMEQGGMKDPYDVLTFDRSGNTKVFAKR